MVALTALSAWLFQQRPFSYGLDVKGGVRLTYQMDTTKLPKGQSIEEVQARILPILEMRAGTGLGVVEANIVKKGADSFVVELPGQTDINKAHDVMSTTAKIEWYYAKNVTTEKAAFREYEEVKADGDKPEVWFRKRGSSVDIKPGSEEYKQIIASWELILAGDELKDAVPAQVPDGYIPSLTFNSDGAKKIETWSRAHTFTGDKLAAVLDGRVINIAPLREGAIISEHAEISGSFTTEYVKELCELLKSGALPVSLVETSASKIDPTVGAFALNKIVTAGIISFGVISLFLLVYYVFPGVVAFFALVLYVLFTLTALKLTGATFSLAAIAGFVLSVGMAVDANILVFERVKEEMREGKPLKKAIDLGFNRALPAIIDSNMCTILTSMVLANLGTGPVKGFATTLIIGVLISLFTAVTVTRSLLTFAVGSGLGANPKWYGLSRQWFGEGIEATADSKPLKIVQKSKTWFIISAVTIVPGIIALALGGLKQNVEFTGGYEGTYNAGATSPDQVRQNLIAAGIKDPGIKVITTDKDKLIAITVAPTDKISTDTKVGAEQLAKMAGFTTADEREFSAVSPQVRAETIRNAVLGIVISSALIIAWLAIRFGFALGGFVIGLRFAVSVIIALVHDIFVVIGLAAVMGLVAGWEISALFISAMLTVIGFSTHDTIVIFDRIRENLRRPIPGEEMGHLVNRSISASIARSLNTSGTVVVTLILLIFFGSATPELKLFNAAMLAGIISGTYSSIFNAAPILYLWDKAVGRKQGEEHTLIGIAKAASTRVRLTPQAAPSAAAPSTAPAAPSTASSYGQTKRRRASDASRGIQSLDDDE